MIYLINSLYTEYNIDTIKVLQNKNGSIGIDLKLDLNTVENLFKSNLDFIKTGRANTVWNINFKQTIINIYKHIDDIIF